MVAALPRRLLGTEGRARRWFWVVPGAANDGGTGGAGEKTWGDQRQETGGASAEPAAVGWGRARVRWGHSWGPGRQGGEDGVEGYSSRAPLGANDQATELAGGAEFGVEAKDAV